MDIMHKTVKEYEQEQPPYMCEKGHMFPHEFNECPICQSIGYKATRCRKCHEWTWQVETENGWCPDCQDELVDRFCKATKEFTKEERNFVFDFIDKDDWEYLGEDN